MIEFRQTKFWIAVVIFATASAFRVLGYIGEDVWLQVVIWVFALYGAGNVAATWAHKDSTKGGSR